MTLREEFLESLRGKGYWGGVLNDDDWDAATVIRAYRKWLESLVEKQRREIAAHEKGGVLLGNTVNGLRSQLSTARSEERERCAKEAERLARIYGEQGMVDSRTSINHVVAAIRNLKEEN